MQRQKQRWRDLLKHTIIKTAGSTLFVLLGIENQSEIHYAMPVRSMNYDAMNYAAQVTEAGKKHRKQKDYATPAEFLSGFGKEDKLTPVITLTVYWGAEKWDAPRSLHDMFSVKDRELENEAVSVINVFTGINIPVNEKEARTDMCKAWEEQLERGKELGKELGMELSAGVYKQIMSGERDNEVIAQNCGCTLQEVEEIRRAFAI